LSLKCGTDRTTGFTNDGLYHSKNGIVSHTGRISSVTYLQIPDTHKRAAVRAKLNSMTALRIGFNLWRDGLCMQPVYIVVIY